MSYALKSLGIMCERKPKDYRRWNYTTPWHGVMHNSYLQNEQIRCQNMDILISQNPITMLYKFTIIRGWIALSKLMHVATMDVYAHHLNFHLSRRPSALVQSVISAAIHCLLPCPQHQWLHVYPEWSVSWISFRCFIFYFCLLSTPARSIRYPLCPIQAVPSFNVPLCPLSLLSHLFLSLSPFVSF